MQIPTNIQKYKATQYVQTLPEAGLVQKRYVKTT